MNPQRKADEVKMKNGTDVMTEVELTTVMTDAPLTRTLEKQVCALPATHWLTNAQRLFVFRMKD